MAYGYVVRATPVLVSTDENGRTTWSPDLEDCENNTERLAWWVGILNIDFDLELSIRVWAEDALFGVTWDGHIGDRGSYEETLAFLHGMDAALQLVRDTAEQIVEADL